MSEGIGRSEEKDKDGGDTLKEQKLQLEAHDKKKMQDISKKKNFF